ncbi:MAG: hybrid sensor histidine kinase/response regulator [Proteobacteria bacterium]|nr:hybrid sensor histidine kinase/response regulator [Pseudomonadota bacterium]
MAVTQRPNLALSRMLLLAEQKSVFALVSKVDGVSIDWVSDLDSALGKLDGDIPFDLMVVDLTALMERPRSSVGRLGEPCEAEPVPGGPAGRPTIRSSPVRGAAENLPNRALDALCEHLPDLPVIALVTARRQGLAALERGLHGFSSAADFDPVGFVDLAYHAIELYRARRTLRAAHEQLIHADRLVSIGQLTAGVAHEINNPAGSLLANLTAMRRQLEEARDAGYCDGELIDLAREWNDILDESITGIGHIRSIVSDLRTFSRAEGNAVGPVDLNAVIGDACKLTDSLTRRSARLVKELGAISTVRGDHGKLVQVFTNLISNAAHAIAGPQMDNEIRVSTTERDGLIISAVQDTGCGIPDHASRLVFEPFFTTKPSDLGTGLGLALSAEIVRDHGGEIGFVPIESGGTRFEVRLPTLRNMAGHPDTPGLGQPAPSVLHSGVAGSPAAGVSRPGHSAKSAPARAAGARPWRAEQAMGSGVLTEPSGRAADYSIARSRGGSNGHSGVVPTTGHLDVPASRAMRSSDDAERVVRGQRSRVLLVDDEPSLLRAFRRLLAPYHEVVMAANGQQALDILARDTAFDGVICDFAMPDIDGISIYQSVAARDRELAGRIVFCTGGPVTGRGRNFIESTSNTVLEKPVPPELLLGAIEQLGRR